MIGAAIDAIQKAIANNPHCKGGLVVRPFVFAVEDGPFGGPELLALLHAHNVGPGYWFGHVLHHPDTPDKFAAALVFTDRLPNAPTVPLLFQRYHYWMTIRLNYHPLCVQNADDAWCDGVSFPEAIQALVTMIRRFDLEKRWPDDDGPYSDSPPETRILGLYGMNGLEQGRERPHPPFPGLAERTGQLSQKQAREAKQ